MMNAQLNNLSREKLHQILAAVGATPAAEETKIQAEEYDWGKPHCFSDWHNKILTNFLKITSAWLTKKLTAFYSSNFNVTIDSISLHFMDEVLLQLFESEQSDYCLAFGTDKDNPYGYISVPETSAKAWVTKLLGEGSTEEDDTQKRMTDLEESLLYDIASLFSKVLCDSHYSFNFKPFQKMTMGEIPFEVQGTEEICKIHLKTQSEGAEDTEANFIIFCDVLEPVVKAGTKKYTPISKIPPEEIKAAALDRIYQMFVHLEAELGSAILSMEDVMNLQVNDIVLLNRGLDEPIEMVAEGQTLFYGRPAKSSGKHAVVITEKVSDLQ
ncbi:MAG: FliM/FliN family flagellar motor C-terminal domain-containing protein [Planctomycetota bacterium]|jgi:flagellar motor switch protein FliM